MTEENTFRTLKRTPYAEIVRTQIYYDYSDDDAMSDVDFVEELSTYLETQGWTYEEFDAYEVKHNIYDHRHADFVTPTDPAAYIRIKQQNKRAAMRVFL